MLPKSPVDLIPGRLCTWHNQIWVEPPSSFDIRHKSQCSTPPSEIETDVRSTQSNILLLPTTSVLIIWVFCGRSWISMVESRPCSVIPISRPFRRHFDNHFQYQPSLACVQVLNQLFHVSISTQERRRREMAWKMAR